MRALGLTIVKNSADPRHWGIGKSLSMEAKAEGYDITNENDMFRAMLAYNARSLANVLADRPAGRDFSSDTEPDRASMALQARLHSYKSETNLHAGARNAGPAVSAHKIGRNEPCPCGSGLKYKKCCGSNKKQ